MINVTQTYFPAFKEYQRYLQGIWKRKWATNHGPLVNELEKKLRKFLGVKHLFFVNNGTTALQIAIKALDLHDEVITTPFSYVATTSSIYWEGCTPVFADIETASLCMDPELIEKNITRHTTAILATHVYGYPCDVAAIAAIARKYRLKVIYDAAHTFGVRYGNRSLLQYGDISTLSFHATKIFHTVEGGAVVTNDDDLAHKIAYLRNFGHKGYEDFWGVGINGKNSEVHAAMGLCVLPEIPVIIEKRKTLSAFYDSLLQGSGLQRPQLRKGCRYNYAYYPVLFPSEKQLLKAKDALNQQQIFPRRYFYPSLNTLNYVPRQPMPITEDVSRRILCLPLFFELKKQQVKKITGIILDNQ